MKNIITDISTTELIEAVIRISEQASDKILEIYETEFDVEQKDDQSPLTVADMAAHKTICHELSIITPDIPILSEESIDIPFKTRKNWQQYWLVDPLDGTREFVKRNGEFTVNIALIENHSPVLGVIFVPVSKLCYYAAKNYGAFKRDSSEISKQIHVRATKHDQYIIAGSRSHGTEMQSNFIKALGENIEMIAIGSSLKFCLVAEGKVDIYPRFGPTSEWDTGAAQCIVEQSGGMVTNTDFNPLRYNAKDSILNPNFLVIADLNFNWIPYIEEVLKD